MNTINLFEPQPEGYELPVQFPDPFNSIPHPLAERASQLLQQKLLTEARWVHQFHTPGEGKMFGVLVVKDLKGRIGYLSAFSGKLAGQWSLPGFVPAIFDENAQNNFLPDGEAELSGLSEKIESYEKGEELAIARINLAELQLQRDTELALLKQSHLERKCRRHLIRQKSQPIEREALLIRLSFDSQRDKREWKAYVKKWRDCVEQARSVLAEFEKKIEDLKKYRSHLSGKLQQKVFGTYQLLNATGEMRSLTELFAPELPSSGTGDCAGPKLIHYAHKRKLLPLALAEFWWGHTPEGSVRHHGHFYPACRGKCFPILPFMLQGYSINSRLLPGSANVDSGRLQIVYQDDDILVIDKPEGLLSVPGKEVQDSVLTRVQTMFPSATGPLLVHRLDLATSGLILVALNAVAHKLLQRQFEKRLVQKRYIAILSSRLSDKKEGKGTITLPLRVDLDDRPRQLVCHRYGRSARTHWEIVSRTENTTRVHFYPITGRTHQLRIHASHQDGLDSPILGDSLYGVTASRLMLHAEKLVFSHPRNEKKMEFTLPAPF